jgi:prolyl oligopeptidase PreP (S9A serine peptidase family)
VPEGSDVIEAAQRAHDALVIEALHDAHGELRVVGTDGAARGTLPFPTLGAVGGVSGRAGDP